MIKLARFPFRIVLLIMLVSTGLVKTQQNIYILNQDYEKPLPGRMYDGNESNERVLVVDKNPYPSGLIDDNSDKLAFGTSPGSEKPQAETRIKANQSEKATLNSSTSQVQKQVSQNKVKQEFPLTEVNKPVIGRGFKADNGVSYQRIHVRQLQKKYLFLDFKLAEKDSEQEVNITVTLEGKSQILIFCTFDGADGCFLPKNKLKQDANIFIYIKCQGDCSYNLKSRWSDLQFLHPGQDYIFMFDVETTQIFHVDLSEKEFEEVRIHMYPRTTRKPFENIKIYGTYGSQKDPTQAQFDFKSVNLWEDGQGVFLLKKNMKSDQFRLLIVGQSETTYRLTCQTVKLSIHQIANNQHLYEYLQAGSSKKYHVQKFDTKLFEQFTFKFSILSGEADVNYYTNKEMTKKLEISPMEYMRDSEYIISKSHAEGMDKNGLYVEVKAQQRDSMYTLKFVGITKSSPIQINQHVYSFVPLTKKPRLAYFNFQSWISETEKGKNLKFTVSMIQVIGKVKPSFRVCKTTFEQCINPEHFKDFTTELPIESSEVISEKTVYQFLISSQKLTKINRVEEEANVIVELVPQSKKGAKLAQQYSLAALQFINNNKVLYLREGRPLQQKLEVGEKKFYKYTNSDQDVEQIRIHLNQISGVMKIVGQVKMDDNTQSTLIYPSGNTLKFTKNLTQPILISIAAETKSIIGITMQIIHKTDTEKNANIMVIGEDLTYNVKIQPLTLTIFEVVPIFYEFKFLYSASSSVLACLLNSDSNKCTDKNGTQTIPKPLSKQQITGIDVSNSGRKARVQVLNPFSDRIVEVSVIFHSRDLNRCQHKSIGKVYNVIAEDKTCYDFSINHDHLNDLSIYVSKREFSSMAYTVFLCGNSIQNVYSQKVIKLNSALINQKCKQSLEDWKVTIYWNLKSKQMGINSVKVDFLAQYEGGVIILPEGVGYQTKVVSLSKLAQKFGFNIINKITTKIIISSIRGFFKSYAKIVPQGDKDSQQISNINYQFQSTYDADYTQEPIITITKKELQQASCQDCFILIAVYSISEEGAIGEFEIEAVQSVQNLNDNTAVLGYLQANSFAYYSYETKQKANTTIIFVISNHNEYCSNLYLGEFEFPDEGTHIAFAHKSSLLAYQHQGGQKKYFLTVQSTKVCQYSITAVTAETSVQNLQGGKQTLIQVVKGNKHFFLFQNYNQPFKILAMSKFGELKFYLNKSSIDVNKKQFTTNELNTNKFTFTSEHSNVLAISQKDPIFCTNCNYFLAVEALKSTISTLFLAYPYTIIPLIQKKYFSDYLQNKGSSTILSYKKIEKTKLQITVHTGDIAITADYKGTKLSQTFTAKSEYQTMILDFKHDQSKVKKIPEADPHLGKQMNTSIRYTQRVPINIIITSQSEGSTYTLLATSLNRQNLEDVASYQSILAGEPNHITISSQKVNCLEGYYRQDNQDLIITVNSDSQNMLKDIIIDGRINKIQANVSRTIVKNLLTLSLTYNESKYIGAFYEICLKYDNSNNESSEDSQNLSNQSPKEVSSENPDEVILKAIVTQVNTINLLSSDTLSIVKGVSTFTIHNKGQILLDVFQCEANGEAVLHYGDSIKTLDSSAGKTIEAVGMSDQKHAIRLSQQNETTYVKLSSPFSTIRWLPINFQTDEGTGYSKFIIGDLRYTSKFKYVSIQYQSLQNIKKSKSTIREIQYQIVISNSSQKLNKASQCDSSNQTGLVVLQMQKMINPFKSGDKTYFTYDVEKQFLQSTFPTNTSIYISVVAKLTLELTDSAKKSQQHRNPSSDEHEHYRFIYNRQQMPLQSFKPSQIEAIPYHFLILLVFSIAGLFLLITYVFSRKIVPLIARLKSSNLVQEKEAQPDVELAEVPPSSDRNQRATEIVVETDERLKK